MYDSIGKMANLHWCGLLDNSRGLLYCSRTTGVVSPVEKQATLI